MYTYVYNTYLVHTKYDIIPYSHIRYQVHTRQV